MIDLVTCLKGIVLAALVMLPLTGCESTGGGTTVATGMYYGTGFYDPYYYGGYWDDDIDIDIDVPERPRPEHPIAKPLPAPVTRPTPMPSTRPSTRPSIPMAPRPMPRGR
jgi:hypothetical protein